MKKRNHIDLTSKKKKLGIHFSKNCKIFIHIISFIINIFAQYF